MPQPERTRILALTRQPAALLGRFRRSTYDQTSEFRGGQVCSACLMTSVRGCTTHLPCGSRSPRTASSSSAHRSVHHRHPRRHAFRRTGDRARPFRPRPHTPEFGRPRARDGFDELRNATLERTFPSQLSPGLGEPERIPDHWVGALKKDLQGVLSFRIECEWPTYEAIGKPIPYLGGGRLVATARACAREHWRRIPCYKPPL